jgi:hypothetical protein
MINQTAMESSIITTVLLTKENGLMMFKMDMEQKNGMMEANIKVSLKTERNVD